MKSSGWLLNALVRSYVTSMDDNNRHERYENGGEERGPITASVYFRRSGSFSG